jgi:hypothetical protein
VLLELRHFSFSQHAPWALAVKELQQSLARALAASHSASHSAIVLPDENPVCAPDVPQALDRKRFISNFFAPPKKREITANNW